MALEIRQRSAIEEWSAERARFHEERRGIIGGSDIAAIVGLSRWRTKMDVWAEKVGLTQSDDEMNLRQFIGLRLEALIAEMAGARLGRTFRRRRGLVRHREFPFLGGHPDFVGLEAKTSYSAEGWGEDGTQVNLDRATWDAIPIDYLLQAQHYLYVTGWPLITVAVLIGHDDFRTYDVRPVPPLIDPAEEEARRFWHENVLTGAVPDLDHSEGTKAYLRSRFPRATGGLRAATAEDTLAIEEYRRAGAAVKAAEEERERLKSILKARIGDDLGLAGPGVTVKWDTVTVRPEVYWDQIAAALIRLVRQATEKKPGKRRRGLRFLDKFDPETLIGLYTGEPTTYRKIDVRYSRREQ